MNRGDSNHHRLMRAKQFAETVGLTLSTVYSYMSRGGRLSAYVVRYPGIGPRIDYDAWIREGRKEDQS